MTLLGASGIMLLLTCVNATNLLLAKIFIKSQEAAGYSAKFAGSRNLPSRLLIDFLAIYTVSVAAGTALAYYASRRLFADSLSDLANVSGVQQSLSFDPRVLGFALGISFVAMVICGLTPLIKAFALDNNARLSVFVEPGKSVLRWLHLILGASATVVQLALAMILITGAGLLFKSFLRLRATDAGFRPDHELTAQLALPRNKYPENAQVGAFYEQIVQRFAALSGVETVGAIDNLPLSGETSQVMITIEDREAPDAMNSIFSDYAVATPNYFRAMGIPLIKGRLFTDQDSAATPGVVMIDAAFSRRFFPAADPVGKRLRLSAATGSSPWHFIIGVVGDVKQRGLENESTGQIYLTAQQQPRASMTLVAHTTVDPMLLATNVQKEVHTLDRDLAVFQIRTMSQVLDESLASRRPPLLCLAAFALLALVQAAIGVYAFAACLTTGDSRYSIIRLAMTEMVIIFAGVGVGLSGAFSLTRLLSSLLNGVSATDPPVFFAGLLSVAGVALIACGVATLAQYLRSISHKSMKPSEGLMR